MIVVYLQYNFEAIHNKDYSVVKTFKSPRLLIRGFFLFNCYMVEKSNIKSELKDLRRGNSPFFICYFSLFRDCIKNIILYFLTSTSTLNFED